MYLSKNDRKLLTAFIKAQGTEANNFVILDNQTVVKCFGCYQSDVDFALQNHNAMKLRIPKESIDPGTQFLMENGLIENIRSEAVLHVTHEGWINRCVHGHEVRKNLINNVLCPIVVALITSVIANLIAALL